MIPTVHTQKILSVCTTDINLPINTTDLFPSHLIDFCPIYPGNIFPSYILENIIQKTFTYLYWQTPSPRWPFQLIEMGQTCSSLAGWHIIWRQSLLGVEGRALGMLWSTCIFIGPIPDYCTLLVFHATQYILIPNQLGELTNIKNKRDNNYK